MSREIRFRAWDGESYRFDLALTIDGEALYKGDVIKDWVIEQYT